MYMYVCLIMCVYGCVYVYVCVCTCGVCVCVCVWGYVCMDICVYICGSMCVHMYVLCTQVLMLARQALAI